MLVHRSQMQGMQDRQDVFDAEMDADEDDTEYSDTGLTETATLNSIENQNSQNLDEVLISVILEKRALWDHHIPAKDKSKLKKNGQWQEVYNSMGGMWIYYKWKYKITYQNHVLGVPGEYEKSQFS